MQTANRLIGTTVSGMFDLRLFLQDHTTQEHADAIYKHTERAYDKYRSRTKIGPFTPTIRVVQDAEQLRLEIVAPYCTRAVAKVRLKTQRQGNDTILTIADQKTTARKTKRAAHGKHINAGYCLNEVRRQLRTNPDLAPEVKRLSSDAKAQLESFLDTCQMRNAGSGDYMFDLDLTDESVTLVAFVNHKRTATVTVFF